MTHECAVVFGYAADHAVDGQEALASAFTAALSRVGDVQVTARRARDYADLTGLMLRKEVDLGWLPPVPYIALARRDAAEPLVSLVRDGHGAFYAVLIVRAEAAIKTPRDLVGTRAAWVDPHSASGYVLPRIGLAAVGVDPKVAFREERFLRSHDAVVRAVLDGKADFGATRGGLDSNGALVHGVWAEGEAAGKLSILATFGGIPPDLVAARADLPTYAGETLTQAFVHAAADAELAALAASLFGVRATFKRGAPPGYEAFRKATMRASEEGLLEGEEKPR